MVEGPLGSYTFVWVGLNFEIWMWKNEESCNFGFVSKSVGWVDQDLLVQSLISKKRTFSFKDHNIVIFSSSWVQRKSHSFTDFVECFFWLVTKRKLDFSAIGYASFMHCPIAKGVSASDKLGFVGTWTGSRCYHAPQSFYFILFYLKIHSH